MKLYKSYRYIALKSFKSKIIVILFIIIIIYHEYFSIFSFVYKEKRNKKIIFSFWEPRNRMPGYLNLCIKTWKKFLPDYQINILDYKGAKTFLGEELYSKILLENMTLPIQADAIRVALLKKYGGIWMDVDTIILDRNLFDNLKNYQLIMLGDEKYKAQNIGFIYSTIDSIIINEWLITIVKKIQFYKNILMKSKTDKNYITILNKITKWNYLGNGIVDIIIKNSTNKQFLRLDRKTINPFPENEIFKNFSFGQFENYRRLYFLKGDPKILLNISKSIIMLHNSWTPFKYRSMTEEDFLKQDILLSKLFNNILNNYTINNDSTSLKQQLLFNKISFFKK